MVEPTLFEISLQKLKFFFHCTGMFVEKKVRKPIDTIKHRSVYLLNFIWLNSDLVGEIFWIKDGIKKGKNLTELTHVAPCFTLEILAHLKSFSLIVYEKELHQLVNNIKELEIMEDKQEKNKNKIIKTEINFLNRVINVLNMFNILMVLFFYLGPMILIGVQFLMTKDIQESESILAMLDAYPFDSLPVKYWPFLFIHQIWTESIVLLEISAADFIFFTCCTYLRIQLLLLKQDIENLIPLESVDSSIKDKRANRVKLTDLIMRHQILISSSNLLETTYTKSTLFNFVSSSFLICLTGFNVTTIDDIGLVMTFATFLFMSLLQIFFLCYFGDLLMESSLGISTAAYNCRWYAADESIRKDLFFVLIRAQKPCRVTAYGYADVNLMAFMGILRAAWSYFALLKTIYG